MQRTQVARRCGLLFSSLLLGSLLIAACAAPPATPERLPTRAYTPVPTPVVTATPTPFSISPWTYYGDGRARHQAGDLTGALRSFDGAIRLDPDFALAYIARGKVYLAQKNPRLALADAETALEIAPKTVEAHVLKGEALRQLQRYHEAFEALDQAVALAPRLREETFHSRWLAARAAREGAALLALAQEYAKAHPGDSLRTYYQGWALLESGKAEAAVAALIEGIEGTANPPALLWCMLSEAYLASRAPDHAVTAAEVTRDMVEAGDTSLAIHSDQAMAELFRLLGRAYLAAGRCVDAEAMLTHAQFLETGSSDTGVILEQARLCLTPTPNPTPYPTTTPSR